MRRICLKAFLRDTRSTTAVEFAMIGGVLFLFLFGIFMMAIVQFWQMTLDDAVRNAAREVKIGINVTTNSAFLSTLCAEFGAAAPNCGGIQYAVTRAATFSTLTRAAVDQAGTLTPSSQFTYSTTANAILVQVAYKIPFSIPLIPVGFTTGNGTASILSATAIMGEPLNAAAVP